MLRRLLAGLDFQLNLRKLNMADIKIGLVRNTKIFGVHGVLAVTPCAL